MFAPLYIRAWENNQPPSRYKQPPRKGKTKAEKPQKIRYEKVVIGR